MKHKKVIWRDIAGITEWQSIEEAKKWGKEMHAVEYTTIGDIIYECEAFIVIAATNDPDEKKYADISYIPRGVIKKIITLK